MWGGAARMGGVLLGVRDAIGTVCRACGALKAGGYQHQVTRPSCEMVGPNSHPLLGPVRSNQKLGCCLGNGKELVMGRDPSPYPHFSGPKIQALRNLGLGRQPEGPGQELA